MKAVIVEIRGNTAVLLSDDGCIVKVRNKNYDLGQEVRMNMILKPIQKKVATFAAAACLMLVLGGGVAAYCVPATQVSFDVNPSIQYSVNIFNRVLTVKGVNDDGTRIITKIKLKNLKNKNIDEAVALTVDQVAKEGYLDAEGAGIVITTSARNMKKADRLAQKLEKKANETCENKKCKAAVNAEAVGKARVAEAKELGVTPGKLRLVEKLKESAQDPDSIDINEWLDKPVREIMAQTRQNKALERKAAKEAQKQKENAKTTGNGSGSGSAISDGSGSAISDSSGSGVCDNSGSAICDGSGVCGSSGVCDSSRSGVCDSSCSGVCDGSCSAAAGSSDSAETSKSASKAGKSSGSKAGNGRK